VAWNCCKAAYPQFDSMTVTRLLSPHAKSKGRREVPKVLVSTRNHSPYGTTCIRCNEKLIAPNWSKYVSERYIRHSWSCESCGHQFETSDDLRINASTKTRQKAPPLSLLVA